MRISEMIERLEKAKEEFGDLPVAIDRDISIDTYEFVDYYDEPFYFIKHKIVFGRSYTDSGERIEGEDYLLL
jgi:hypothetical protein